MGPDTMEKTRPDISHSGEHVTTPDNPSFFIPGMPDCDTREFLSEQVIPGEPGENPFLEKNITLLFAPDYLTRTAAAEALGILGDQRAIEPLFRASMDEQATVREAAREALARISVRYRQKI